MDRYKNLIVIGTSHISKESVSEVRNTINKEKPEVVALELDKGRLQGLLEGKKTELGFHEIKILGVNGWLFAKLGEYAERKLGQSVGVKPGTEMLEGFKVAKENNCRIALIDKDIRITLKKISENFTWKEKFNVVLDIIKNIFSKKRRIKFDLNKVPEKELIKNLLDLAKKNYPNLYRVLVTDRNKFMARKLITLMQEHSVLAVVGAGHEKGLIEEIKKLEKSEFVANHAALL